MRLLIEVKHFCRQGIILTKDAICGTLHTLMMGEFQYQILDSTDSWNQETAAVCRF